MFKSTLLPATGSILRRQILGAHRNGVRGVRRASDAIFFSWGFEDIPNSMNHVVLKREADTTKFSKNSHIVVPFDDYEFMKVVEMLETAGLSGNHHKLSTGFRKLFPYKWVQIITMGNGII
eukprot:INCI14129.1.p1 GENE.INCI14129.1~~INCI14129.1.p1  ORF type:complete len:121 (-),score=12.58 INCI14129.1:4-366(-)